MRCAPREVDVWWMELAGLEPRRLGGDMLDEHERRRRASLRRAEDRRRYEAAHAGLRVLLGAYLGVVPADVPIARASCPLCGGPHGKPGLEGHHGLQFSLARSGSIAVYAFASGPVGIDVELMHADQPSGDALAALHPAERRGLERLHTRRDAFYRCFVRKEAYLKGLGAGLAVEPGGLELGFGAAPDLGPWKVRDVAVGAGYAAALALRADGEPIVRRRALDVSASVERSLEQHVDHRWTEHAYH